MNAGAENLAWLHEAGDGLIAVSCFLIAAAFSHFAARNRAARLSRPFALFAVLFGVGGLTHVCEAAGWHAAGAVFKTLTALACVAGAALTWKYLPVAGVMFARAAVVERRAAERLIVLREDPRFDTQEDREWQVTLSEIKDLARLAREAVQTEEV